MMNRGAAATGRRGGVGPVVLLAAAAMAISATGVTAGNAHSEANLLLSGVYLAGLGLGALFFVALLQVTGARWGDPASTITGRIPSLFPVATALLLPVFLAGPEIYSWTNGDWSGPRGIWLSRPAFIGRSVVYLGLWILSARLLARRPESPGIAAAVLAIAVVTGWLTSSDWLMSLTPGWASTIFGIYVFAGFVVSAVALVLLACICLRRWRPEFGVVTDHQLHDLAKWLFGLSCLWLYLWYCQYMLIWYTDQPHEMSYYGARTADNWGVMFLATVVLNWVLPFALLLSRAGRRNVTTLALAGASSLLGHWLDLYVMIFPGIVPDRPAPGLLEGGLLLGVGAACAWLLGSADSAADVVPASTKR